MACRRIIVWNGLCKEIEAPEHSYAWSGQIPCTGVLRCIYCGRYKDDEEKKTKEQGGVRKGAL